MLTNTTRDVEDILAFIKANVWTMHATVQNCFNVSVEWKHHLLFLIFKFKLRASELNNLSIRTFSTCISSTKQSYIPSFSSKLVVKCLVVGVFYENKRVICPKDREYL